MAAVDPVVELQDVVVRFRTQKASVQALRGIRAKVNAGEFIGVIGPSGAGKSTLLRCMNLLLSPTEGRILFRGVAAEHLSEFSKRKLRRQTGMIFQRHQLIGRFSVRQNVQTGLFGKYGFFQATWGFLRGRFSPADEQAVDAALHELGIAERGDARVDQLSGGQQQRVAIARALVQQPILLLADEPIASLDEGRARDVMDQLQRLNDRGLTVVCNLHDVNMAKAYSTRILALSDGTVVFDDTPEKLTEDIREEVFRI